MEKHVDKERNSFVTTPDIEATIMHLARIRSARKLLETEENILKAEIKAIAADVGCDEFLAERDGQLVPIAYLADAPALLDRNKLKNEYEDIYNQCLVQQGIEDRYLYITNKALPTVTKKETAYEQDKR